MHQSFSDWYRIAAIEPTEEILNNRWEGIEAVVSKLDTQSSLDLVRLFLGKLSDGADFKDKFKNSFKEADPTFRMTDNELELQVLAGVSIIQCLSGNKNDIVTAIATICAYFQDTSSMPPLQDVPRIAHEFVVNRSLGVRSRGEIASIKTDLANLKEQKQALLEQMPQNNYSAAQEQMDALIGKIQQNNTQLISKINKTTRAINDSLLLQQEETQMLWWLMGEYSTTVNMQMSKIPLPFACLIVANELSEHTQIVPGPITIRALIDRMLNVGRKSAKKESSIKEVINKATSDWKKQYLSEIQLGKAEDLCPMHYALAKSNEAGDKTSWVPIFKNKYSMDADKPIAVLDITVQIYNEMLLLRSIE